MKIWAVDDGYGDNKLYAGKELMLLPSFYTYWRKPLRSDFDTERQDWLDYLAVEIDGYKYLVGKAAMENDSGIMWVGGNNKHEDKGFPILLKTCLALLAEDDVETVDLLVMGLPVRADEDEARHKLLESLVVGTHNVKLILADGTELDREIRVKKLIVKKQPFGSFCDVILDDSGEIQDRAVAKGFNVVVDIGARTLNVYTLNALRPVTDLSLTTNHGMYTAYNWVGEHITSMFGEVVPTGKLPYIIARKEIRGYDLRPIIENAYEMLANEIKKILESLLINSWVFVDRLIFTGGGAELLRPWLEESFANKPTVFLGRFSTVRGLWKYGVRQAMKEAGETAEIRIKAPKVKVKNVEGEA